MGEIFGQISYDFGLPFVPYAGFTQVSVTNGAFTETGGLAALTGAAASDNLTYSTLGARIPLGGFAIEDMRLTPRADIGWSHAFSMLTPSQSLNFSSGPGFAIRGAPLGTDAAMIQFGLDLAITPQALLSLGYDGTFYGRGQSHAFRGGLNWQF
jgi:outer membrane autotransporter protein